MTYYSEKDTIVEKGNWIACKGIQTVPQRYAVKRKGNPTNKLVPTYPLINIELMFESDAKLLVSLLARLEKLAVSSLKQIRKESHALRATAAADSIENKEAERLTAIAGQLTTRERAELASATEKLPPRVVRIVTP